MPISLLIFKEEYYYSCKQAPPTYSAPYILSCLGTKINFFNFGYSFQGSVQSPTVFLFMVMKVTIKSLLLAKGSEFSVSVIALAKKQTQQ